MPIVLRCVGCVGCVATHTRTLRSQASTGQDAMGAESPSIRHNFMLFVVFMVQTARGQNTVLEWHLCVSLRPLGSNRLVVVFDTGCPRHLLKQPFLVVHRRTEFRPLVEKPGSRNAGEFTRLNLVQTTAVNAAFTA